MKEELQDYFDFLYGEESGRFPVVLMDENRQYSREKWFTWPEQAEEAFSYIKSHRDEDVVTTPALFKTARRAKLGAKVCRVVYADADTFNLEDLRCAPSLIVHTSEDKTHIYFALEDSTDPIIAENLAHGLSKAHPKDLTGMDDGWPINKLLRVPGTTNTKYKHPHMVRAEFTGTTYTEEEFASYYPPVHSGTVEFREPGDLPSYGEALGAIRTSTTLESLITSRFAKGSSGSEALFKLQNELFRLGATDEVAFVVCKNSGLNKFARDGKENADALLWEDILRARAKVKETIFNADEELHLDRTIQPVKKNRTVDFLSDSEKNALEPTFIDSYIDWASSKTDAARVFHVASAFTILSTVFSDFGHAMPKFGRLPLNMWFMVLGETTRSRKSTTRGQMLSFIRALSDDDEFNYDLGSDFTPEALDNALLDRPHRSGIVHRDEVQGFFKELDSKAYMAGAKGKLTELYDGHVSGKLRATGDNKRRPSVPVSLVLFVMGIRDHVADYLTQEDFQSGFLTRFIYVEAEAPPRTKESDYLEQADVNEVSAGDPIFRELVDNVEQSRMFWADFNDSAGPTVPVPCAKDAWERLNLFITDVLNAAEGEERYAIIEASSQRLTLSILKAATLLAMMDCCEQVELKHMRAAINYCDTWFVHMVNMANRISESNWKRRLDGLLDFVLGKGGTVPWDTAYKKFSSEMKPRDFLEVVNSLEESAQLEIKKDVKTNKRYLSVIGDE